MWCTNNNTVELNPSFSFASLSRVSQFYYAFKLAFLLWAMAPQTQGATFIYNSFLRDFLRSNQGTIDEALARAQRSASDVMGEAATAGADIAGSVLKAAAKKD